jgi:hypothetical protein
MTLQYNPAANTERYDGLFVLHTDTDHDAETIARVLQDALDG